MDILASLQSGFMVALSFTNLWYCFIGVLIGTIVGVLPGLGPVATIALLLPITYNIPPEAAIIMLAGIYYGAMYGGSITSILLDLPGEAASVVTTFDGYQMAKQGRAGAALGISTIGSFVAGTVAVIGLSLFAPTLADWAVRFGPPEYTALTAFGILLVAYLGTKSFVKSIISASFGLLFACVGQDPITGSMRFTFGSLDLMNGLEFAAMAMGLFGIAEILHNLEDKENATIVQRKLTNIWPTLRDLSESKWAILRGSVIGFFVGILPGGGAVLSSMVSYQVEKRISKTPEKFGHGAIQGVAGPESANNSAAGSSFIPLLTLGIPGNAVMALIFGALLMQGITPGPALITEHSDLFWGVIASMYVGNLLLLLLNLPLVGMFVQLLRVRSSILAPFTIMISLVGVYSINNSSFDMWVVVFFGALGYLMRKFGFEPGPMVLAFVLGKIMEKSLRQTLLMSNGDISIFLTRPVSATIIGAIVILLLIPIVSYFIKKVSVTRAKTQIGKAETTEH